MESSADGVHDCLRLHLSPVRAVVYHDGGDDVAAVLVPEIDLILNYLVLCRNFHPFGLVFGTETISYALLRPIPVKARQVLVRKFRALLTDFTAAIVVDLGDVAEEQISLMLLIGLLVDTLLSQILEDDFLATQLVAVVSCAVPTSSVAVGLDEVVSAVHALPVDEVRSHKNTISELFINILEVLQEIEHQIIVRGIPHIVLNSIVGPGHFELNHNGYLILGSLITFLHEINQLLSIIIRNEHGRDSETGATSVIRHDDLIDVFLLIINDDGETCSGLLDVSDFLNECAVSTICQVERNII